MSDRTLEEERRLYKLAAEKLWQLLDDIDTSSDAARPEQTDWYHYVMGKVDARKDIMESDGHDLTLKE